MLIGTNGRVTEYIYLRRLKLEPWVRRRAAVVFESGSPEEVVRATARRAIRDDYDDVWAVCDVDEFDVAAADAAAEQGGVVLVWSMPCFEVWLILHFGECTKPLEAAKKSHEKLRKLLPAWDKSRLNFDDFRGGVQDATRRAKQLGDPPAANPSTHMWRLVEVLMAGESGS